MADTWIEQEAKRLCSASQPAESGHVCNENTKYKCPHAEWFALAIKAGLNRAAAICEGRAKPIGDDPWSHRGQRAEAESCAAAIKLEGDNG